MKRCSKGIDKSTILCDTNRVLIVVWQPSWTSKDMFIHIFATMCLNNLCETSQVVTSLFVSMVRVGAQSLFVSVSCSENKMASINRVIGRVVLFFMRLCDYFLNIFGIKLFPINLKSVLQGLSPEEVEESKDPTISAPLGLFLDCLEKATSQNLDVVGRMVAKETLHDILRKRVAIKRTLREHPDILDVSAIHAWLPVTYIDRCGNSSALVMDLLQPYVIDVSAIVKLKTDRNTGNILCMHPANERRPDIVTSSLIGWAHISNEPWKYSYQMSLRTICVNLYYPVTVMTGNVTFCQTCTGTSIDARGFVMVSFEKLRYP